MEHLKAKFMEEATDLLSELEKSLLMLEHSPANNAGTEQLFRIMHSLKGSSGMFGYTLMEEFTHHLETIYDYVRSGHAAMTEELLSVTLLSVDHLRLLLLEENINNEELQSKHTLLMATISEFVVSIEANIQICVGTEDGGSHKSVQGLPAEEGLKQFEIVFKPVRNILLNGTNPLYLIEELHSLGICTVTAHFNDIPSLEDLDPVM